MIMIIEKELETLIETIYSHDSRMEFGIEKCGKLIIKNGKRQITEGTELPNQERIRMIGEKETYKYMGILEADSIKQGETKEKNEKKKS